MQRFVVVQRLLAEIPEARADRQQDHDEIGDRLPADRRRQHARPCRGSRSRWPAPADASGSSSTGDSVIDDRHSTLGGRRARGAGVDRPGWLRLDLLPRLQPIGCAHENGVVVQIAVRRSWDTSFASIKQKKHGTTKPSRPRLRASIRWKLPSGHEYVRSAARSFAMHIMHRMT